MTGRSTVRSISTLIGAVVTAVAITGCGVPTGDKTFTAIPPAEVLYGLDATSTTTSTTTTTVPVVPETTTAPSTTTPIRLDPAEIYFLRRGRLQPLDVMLVPDFSADEVIEKLEAGPPPDLGLETLIDEGLIVSSTESRAVLTVDLDARTFARIPSTQQTEAIGQIVMTMISSLQRVGLVNFTIDDEPIAVKKGNSLLSEVGEPLSYEDYTVLLVNPEPRTGTTTSTVVVGPLATDESPPDDIDGPTTGTLADQ